MLTSKDRENLEKAAQTAALLVGDLQVSYGGDSVLLAELVHGLLENAVALKDKLDRLVVITSEGS
jgi:hypothetical protein